MGRELGVRRSMRGLGDGSGASSSAPSAGATVTMDRRTCSTVRGKPSRMNPLAQSASLMRSRMIDTTSSSLTRPPASMTLLACWPTSEPAATAARSMSPVDSCGMESVSTILGAWGEQRAGFGGSGRDRLGGMGSAARRCSRSESSQHRVHRRRRSAPASPSLHPAGRRGS
jgi:hypothetical protein